jgi:TonB family protein
MRKQALLLFLFGMFATASIGAATGAQSLGARSVHHELRVERSVVSADQIAYEVRVIDLDSGNVVLNSHATGKPGEALDATAVSGDEQIRVRLAYSRSFFSATVNVTRGETILDEFRTWWQLEPRVVAQTPVPTVGVAGLNAPQALRVGGEVKAPIVLVRTEPAYTEEARRDRISGITIVEVLIGKDGLVKDAMVLKPLPDGLSEAALDAVRQWRFKPATLHGEPVDVIFNLTVNFKLDTTPAPPPR